MGRVDLEGHLVLGDLLACGLEHAAHLRREALVGVGHEAARAVDEAGGDAHAFDAVAERLLDAFDKTGGFANDFLVLLFLFAVGELAELEVGGGHGDELMAFELGHALHHPLVDALRHQEDFDALAAEGLEVRGAHGGLEVAGGEVVDVLLLLGHAGHVVGEAHVLLGRAGLGGGKAQELEDGVAVGVVLDGAFLHDGTEVLPEDGVLFLIVLRELAEHVECTLREGALELLRHAAFLEKLAGDVERQVGGVDEAADEAQVVRQELLGVVHDEDALHEELEAVLLFTRVEVPRGFGRRVEKGRVLELALDAVVGPAEGIAIVVREVLVEGLVLVFRHVLRGQRPEGAGVVDLLPGARHFSLDDVLVVLLHGFLLLPEEDGRGDVVGVLRDRVAQAPLAEELLLVLLEVKDDLGAAGLAGDVAGGEGAVAVGLPLHGFLGTRTRLA